MCLDVFFRTAIWSCFWKRRIAEGALRVPPGHKWTGPEPGEMALWLARGDLVCNKRVQSVRPSQGLLGKRAAEQAELLTSICVSQTWVWHCQSCECLLVRTFVPWQLTTRGIAGTTTGTGSNSNALGRSVAALPAHKCAKVASCSVLLQPSSLLRFAT